MPRRVSIKTVNAEEIQGEGAYIKFTPLKVKEIREIRGARDDPDRDSFEAGMEMLTRHVAEWNLVDDEGQPLPLPSEDPEVINDLTDEEATFMVLQLTGSDQQKN